MLWSAFKLIVRGASADEKGALFAGTAARFYELGRVTSDSVTTSNTAALGIAQ